MKKIIHIISTLGSGGAEGVLFRLVNNNSSNKHYIISFSKGGFYAQKLRKNKIKIYSLDFTNIKNVFFSIYKIKKIFNEIKPDILQTWLYHADLIGGFIGKISGIKKICWGIRGSYEKELTSLRTKIIVKICSAFSYWIPDVIISNSKFAKKKHVKSGYNKKIIYVIPNGFEIKKYLPNKNFFLKLLNINNNIPKNTIFLSMVARYDPHKDYLNLFNALNIIKCRGYKFYLVLIGSKFDNNNILLLKKIKQYNLLDNIFLLGERNDVLKILPNIDINILSSMSESFPNVIAEAMLAKVPCISTDVGDTKFIIGDTGWIVPRKSPLKLAKAICDAINKKKSFNKWNARKNNCHNRIANNFELKKMITRYDDIWK
jgi:glycosyltransferase involved in cell wall biosynthesis